MEQTFHEEWNQTLTDYFRPINHLLVGQLDGDPALEILVGGQKWYDTRLQVFDGITHTREWETPESWR